MVRLALAIAVVLAACQGQSGGTKAGSASGAEPGSAQADASGFGQRPIDAAEVAAPEDALNKPEEPEVPDPGKTIAELGAIPAWQAVVDRAMLLARRKQRGIVYGRVGPVVTVPAPPPATPPPPGPKVDAGVVPTPYVWLVDDTEGNGTLGIRVKLDGRAKEGERVALAGAWELDGDRRWFWTVDAVHPLPPAPASDLTDPPAPVPSHAIAQGNLPSGARTISVAKDHDAVYFQIVGPAPITDGDGWLVADELGDPPFALMSLPGERASYGGQDMRAPDERWQLKRGQTYWVRIGKLRKRGLDKPALVNARTAPIRVM